ARVKVEDIQGHAQDHCNLNALTFLRAGRTLVPSRRYKMIELVDLVKKYGDFTALHGITFSVPKGQILGLLGPNGAGKSTTMKILSCFMPATSGQAKVAGYDVFEDPF